MHADTVNETAPRPMRSVWIDENARGLSHAAAGDWPQAVTCFAAAAEALSDHSDVEAHEALALVLSNLAQGCFAVNQIDDAIRHAQRACSLRAALMGDDAVSTARARADFAVMLAHAGRVDESLLLIRRALASVERNVGDDDAQLITLLENAARLALVAGQPSTAEPYLLRLHALLEAFEMSTERADTLFARVAQSRSHPVSMTPVASTYGATVVDLDIDLLDDSSDTIDVADDLRFDMVDAADDVHDVPERDVAPHHVAHADAFEMETVGAEARLDIFGGASFDLVDEPVPAAPPTSAASLASPQGLGFTVEYGVVSTGPAPDPADVVVPPPTSTRILTPYESMPAALPPVALPPVALPPVAPPPVEPPPVEPPPVASQTADRAPAATSSAPLPTATSTPSAPGAAPAGESTLARRFRRWSLRT